MKAASDTNLEENVLGLAGTNLEIEANFCMESILHYLLPYVWSCSLLSRHPQCEEFLGGHDNCNLTCWVIFYWTWLYLNWNFCSSALTRILLSLLKPCWKHIHELSVCRMGGWLSCSRQVIFLFCFCWTRQLFCS